MLPTERRARRPRPATSIPSMSTIRTMPGRRSASRPQARYGTFTIDAAGVWTYTLDNNNTAVQALNVGQTLTDTFTATTVDGTAQLVTITINGTNDAAVISGAANGSVTEAGGVANGTPTATGDLNSTDVDNSERRLDRGRHDTDRQRLRQLHAHRRRAVDLHAGQQQCGRAGAQCGRDADRHLHGDHDRRHRAAGDHHHQRQRTTPQ